MQSAAILLIVVGAFVLYAVVHGRLAPSESPPAPSSAGGGGGGSTSSGGGGGTDSGTHQAIDQSGQATGTVGAVYTINSTYGAANDQQQGDMNAFARQIGNVIG